MLVSDWEGDLSDYDLEGINVTIPWLLARLNQHLDSLTLDLSVMEPGIDVREQRIQPDPANGANPVGVTRVNSLTTIWVRVVIKTLRTGM